MKEICQCDNQLAMIASREPLERYLLPLTARYFANLSFAALMNSSLFSLVQSRAFQYAVTPSRRLRRSLVTLLAISRVMIQSGRLSKRLDLII